MRIASDACDVWESTEKALPFCESGDETARHTQPVAVREKSPWEGTGLDAERMKSPQVERCAAHRDGKVIKGTKDRAGSERSVCG